MIVWGIFTYYFCAWCWVLVFQLGAVHGGYCSSHNCFVGDVPSNHTRELTLCGVQKQYDVVVGRRAYSNRTQTINNVVTVMIVTKVTHITVTHITTY